MNKMFWFFLGVLVATAMLQETPQNGTECDPDYIPDPVQNEEVPSFSQFIILYNKIYATDEQKQNKCKNYYENVQDMRIYSQDITWTVGVNENFDYSKQELQSRAKINQYQDGDLHKVSSNSISIQVGQPAEKDWRKDGVVTSIKNQGSCGSCWSFATCAYGQSKLIIQKKQGLDIDLSEQFLIDCTDGNSCNGGFLQTSFEQAADSGVPTESSQPYQEKDSFFSFFSCWSLFKIHFGYIPERHYNLKDQQLKQLLEKGPVAISISSKNWTPYKSGVFRCNPRDGVDHAVLLVGYTADYWIIKNQWGSSWGQDGYMRVTTSPNYNCKIGTSAFIMFEEGIKAIQVLMLVLVMVIWIE